MKLLSLSLVFTATPLWAKPIVLVTYYDGFNGAPANNSGTMAKLLQSSLKNSPDVDLRLCELSTSFDKAYYQQEACIKSLPETPQLVIGMGEAQCLFKVELLAKNFDQTTNAPDNAGIRRYGTQIVPGAYSNLGFTYPLVDMYCALHKRDRRLMEISNDAGSFVCNNTAYQMSYNYPEINYGFIHVPSYYCTGVQVKNEAISEVLSAMIIKGATILKNDRLPTTEKEYKALRKQTEGVDECKNEFYERAKGADKRSFWSRIN
ncbi:MAG TPA: hypothetical protein VNJ01_15740 [Bacteriovoracaceae bacterium]|nr:hypothetical protein [Bacteriovoracaceae bacterium]